MGVCVGVAVGEGRSRFSWLFWVNLFSELGSCVKVEVAVLVSPSLISLMVSVDGK